MAELKGHHPDVAEAFVTRDKEVKIDGVVVHEAGHVLNLNTIDATRQIGGRPVLAKGVANSIEDIVAVNVDWEVNAVAVTTRNGLVNLEEKMQKRTKTTGCGQGTVFGDVAQLDAFMLGGEHHHVIARHAAAAQGRKADRPA